MNTTSASPAELASGEAAGERILVWDAPVRVFHWLMVLSFFGAWLTADSERWRLLHVTLGYTMAGLVAFRLAWGLVGTRHARFAAFVRGPAAIGRYLASLVRGEPEHHAGHNPAGALAIVLMIALTIVIAASGWLTLDERGGDVMEDLHEAAAQIMLAVVGIHVLGVIVASVLHHENLVGAMVTGRKRGLPRDAVRSAWRSVAGLMLIAVLAFWWSQWSSAPPLAGSDADVSAARPAGDGGSARRHDDDDD